VVAGLEQFAKHFERFADHFVLIGGAACDLWMSERELRFRATEDLDIVVVVDLVDDAYIRAFWDFIREGKYATHQQSQERPDFYRFAEPEHVAHPKQIELLTRNGLGLPDDARFTPIPAGHDLSSLSAILMDGSYYDYVLNSRIVIGGIPTVPAQCLIPLKAKAHLDLKARREAGDTRVRGDDIRKHRNDIFALAQTLAPEDRYSLPDELQGDVMAFLETLPAKSGDWQAINQSVRTVLGADYMLDPDEARQLLIEVFGL
jgi:hypothetical protein